MKTIKLTQGYEAVVDDEDFDWLSKWKWSFSHGYAVRGQYLGRDESLKLKHKYKRIYMHKEINKTPQNFETDHINRDRLDNRKENLRTVTRTENSRNHSAHKQNITGVRGVVWRKRERLYVAQIGVNKKSIRLGYFKDIHDAIKARKQAEAVYYEGI